MTHRSLGRFLAVLAAALVSVAVLTGLPAQAADDISFGVQVRDQGGDPVAGATIDYYTSDPADGPATSAASGQTDEQGLYGATVPAGRYWITAAKAGYRTKTHVIDVSADGYTPMSLEPSRGMLGGRILDPDGRAGNTCVSAVVYRAGQAEVPQPVATVQVDEYTRRWQVDLPTGEYVVQALDRCDHPELWVGGQSYATAKPYEVEDAKTTTIPTVTQQRPSTLRGKVVDAAGKPVQGVQALLYAPGYADYYAKRSVRTNSRGEYTFEELAPGSDYQVLVADGDDYQNQWYQGAQDRDSATRITLGSGTKTLDTIRLTSIPREGRPSTLKGTVRDLAGTGVRGLPVALFHAEPDQDGNLQMAAYTVTSQGGGYTFDVAPGRYKVRVGRDNGYERSSGSYGTEDAYRAQWFGGAYSFRNAAVVSSPQAKTLAPVTLESYGSIAGTVVAPTTRDDDYQWTNVEVRGLDGSYYYVDSGSGTRWSTYQLPAGTYTVRFTASRNFMEGWSDLVSVPFVPEYWSNQAGVTTARRVVVKDGQHVTGVDATLSSKLLTYAAPRVTGPATKGKKLTSSLGTWNSSQEIAFARQWLRDGKAISGATGSSYTLTSSDVGRRISVRVSAQDKNDQFGDGVSTSASTAKVKKK
ncbi:MAG: carboxypeptidase regulatory-like domain-containing protein [Aeromicrobium erythreum]